MSQDVSQWLAEITSLKQQLAEAQRDREEANAGAAKWRQLYTTEAQQRRIDAKLTQQTIDSLKAEIQQLRGLPLPKPEDSAALPAVQETVDKLQTIDELKQKLIEVIVERDRLVYDLKQEQANHIQTRKNLTVALGDAIDRLTKEQAARNAAVNLAGAQDKLDEERNEAAQTQVSDDSALRSS